jgi:pyruvoyl-dependent arginine decarboxylase (PvlArgDC)
LLLDSNEAYEDNVQGLNDVAIANKRLQKGVQTLADDWESFDKALSKDNLTLLELSSILPEINVAL